MSLKFNITKTLSTLIFGTIIFILACQKDEPKPVNLISISVKTAPSKVDYYVGETLDLSGLIITLHMDNESVKDVAFSDFISEGIFCSPENETILTAEITEVTITHTVSEISVSQSFTYNTLTDIDGNIYPLVEIGSQIWMAENLKVTTLNDGTPINLFTKDSIRMNGDVPNYCWFNDTFVFFWRCRNSHCVWWLPHFLCQFLGIIFSG